MWNTISMLGINWGIWFCLLGVFFCVAESLRLIFTEGRNYWEEHTIVGMLIRWGKENRGEVHEKRHLLKKAWKDMKAFLHHQYEQFFRWICGIMETKDPQNRILNFPSALSSEIIFLQHRTDTINCLFYHFILCDADSVKWN